ncbi:MAG: ABC transporter ATP-binding protein [Erysipelotrichaceae bacterium]|nr:ABC transporter ATP-binding protein [Erysipelotrichaceae bacterium]
MKNKLELKNVSKSFKHNDLLSNINQSFLSGNVYGIIGPNGSGKTVLFKLISGLMNVSSGEIFFNGTPIKQSDVLFGVSIEKPQLIEDLTVMENLLFLANIRNTINKEIILEYLKQFNLYDARNKKVKNISMGMKQKVSLIQSVMENPEIILFDEVSNSLDYESKDLLYELVKKEKEAGKIILYINHNLEEVKQVCDEIYEIRNKGLLKWEKY